MMAIAPLLGTAIDNASEMHSLINVRLGVAQRISNSIGLTARGVVENQ